MVQYLREKWTPGLFHHDRREALRVPRDVPGGERWRVRRPHRFHVLAGAVLLLAAFNLSFRIDREVVTRWDESLYARSAWEMVQTDRWIAHTFGGELDYYNLKPPLNIWLIAGAFKRLGVSLVSLRLASMVCAWLSVLALMWWTRRQFGDVPALLAGLVLATSFASIYVHAGRSGNPDAPFTLVVLLTVIAASAARSSPVSRLWLGPLAAAAFMLKGMAVLLPLAIAGAAELLPPHRRPARWRTLAVAAVLGAVPVGLWAIARWRIDGWQFLGPLVGQDFVARALQPLDEHQGSPFYYLNILQMYHYDWLIAGVAGAFALWRWQGVSVLRGTWAASRSGGMVVIWASATFLVPTLMRTKLAWYLNPFYPAFALGVALVLAASLRAAADGAFARQRRRVMATVLVLALGVAEGRLLYYSFDRRDLGRSAQGLLLTEAAAVRGRQVFGTDWTHADWFVAAAIAGVDPVALAKAEAFWEMSQPGDLLLSREPVDDPRLAPLRRNPTATLYVRQE